MNGTVANGTPSNRLCAGIVNFLDSEKTSEVVRGWKQDGFPDATAFGGAIDYGDVPLSNFLSVIERITLKDREASTSTSLLRAQRGLRDPSLELYKRITKYCKAIEAVGHNMGNAFEIAPVHYALRPRWRPHRQRPNSGKW